METTTLMAGGRDWISDLDITINFCEICFFSFPILFLQNYRSYIKHDNINLV